MIEPMRETDPWVDREKCVASHTKTNLKRLGSKGLEEKCERQMNVNSLKGRGLTEVATSIGQAEEEMFHTFITCSKLLVMRPTCLYKNRSPIFSKPALTIMIKFCSTLSVI